jgi:hypothetical protein
MQPRQATVQWGSADHRPAAHSLRPACRMTPGGRATGRFCGPRLFGPVMERSNSGARIGGHSHPVDDQTVRRLTDSPALVPAYSL